MVTYCFILQSALANNDILDSFFIAKLFFELDILVVERLGF